MAVAKKLVVKLTANFERNLADIEYFLTEAGAPHAYDALLDELLDTVIPNLERFPGMGRVPTKHLRPRAGKWTRYERQEKVVCLTRPAS